MPARVIRGEINESDSLCRVSMAADLTFRALIVSVDDYGRMDARPAKLKAALFPMRGDVTAEMVAHWVAELAALAGAPVQLYEVAGLPFLCLTGWERHRGKSRRAKVSRCPDPPHVETPTPSPEAGDIEHPRRSENPPDFPLGVGSGSRKRESRVGVGKGESPSAPSDDGKIIASAFAVMLKAHVKHARIPANLDAWARVFDLMLRGTKEVDPISRDDIRKVVSWVVRDDFEQNNVQSPTKLRKRFAALYGKATRTTTGGKSDDLKSTTERLLTEARRRAEDPPDLDALRVVPSGGAD